MESSILDVEKYVDILYSSDANTEEYQEADGLICHWQYSENVFEDCFTIITREVNSSKINSNLMFISIKTLQTRIRRSFKELSSDTINSIFECLIAIVKFCASQYESENPENEKEIVVTPQLRYSLIAICDIITISKSYFTEIEEMIPNCLKIHFLELFFEETQEKYHKCYSLTKDLIQYSLIEYGLEFLSNSPMSTEWVRCFGSIVKIIDSYETIIPLMPRLTEAIAEISSISALNDVLCSIYEGVFTYKPFLDIIVEFHIAYSIALREISDSDDLIHQFLQLLWNSFFKINLYELENRELLFSSFQEFFEVVSILNVDVNLWAELLNSARKLLSEMEPFNEDLETEMEPFDEELEAEMEPIKITFLQLCSRLFMQLIETYCQYKSKKAEDNDEDNDFSVITPYVYDHTIKNLHLLSKKLLNQFLAEENPKTIGLLKIAGMNAKCLDHDLLCHYAEFALSFTENVSESEILVVTSFINSSFLSIQEYVVQFISYEIQVFPIIPYHASYALHYMSQKCYESFPQADSDILGVLFNLMVKYGHNTTKANVIIIILNILSHTDPIDTENPIFKQISSYCEHFAQFAQNGLHNLISFVEFIQYLCKYSNYPDLAFFYNGLSVSLISSLGDVCKNLDNEYQHQMSKLFESLMSRNWLKEYSIAAEYVQQAIENGITQRFHINRIVVYLPVELIPPNVFDLCNAAFIPLSEMTTNKNMCVNAVELKFNEEEAENVIDTISDLIFYIAQKRSFEHLSLFNPQLFTEIILNTKLPNKCDHIYRTIKETLDLCQFGEVPHDILVSILRGCTMKSFRCQSYEERFLQIPMIILTKLLPQDEYFEIFFSSIPAAASESAKSDEGNNPAMIYLHAIYNPVHKSIEFSKILSNFVEFITMSAEEAVQ